MTALKWTWKIIWRCILIPVIVAFAVMIGSMFFIDDSNQWEERGKEYEANYGTSYQRNRNIAENNPTFANKFNRYNSLSDKKYTRKYQEMENSDFDLAAIVTMIALFGSFVFMVIYTIYDFRDFRKQNSLTKLQE